MGNGIRSSGNDRPNRTEEQETRYPDSGTARNRQVFSIQNLYFMRGLAAVSFLLILLFGPQDVRAQEAVIRPVTYDALLSEIKDTDAEVTVVNFWATWCGPCREEFPAFVQLGKDFESEGVRVLFVSMDFDDEVPEVAAFLAEQNWDRPSYLRTGNDHEFISALHDEWSGVLPATMVYRQEGELVDFWQGEPVTFEELHTRVLNAVR